MMKRVLIVFAIVFGLSVVSQWAVAEDIESITNEPGNPIMIALTADSAELPPSQLLNTAISGYKMLLEEKRISCPGVITIIDFSLPSNKKRLWVLDLVNGKVLFHCLVSHGRNSGDIMAENFSNIPGSFASSPGFYSTGQTYVGKHGLSLILDGLEKGINDKARDRAIVMHGADYVSSDFIRKYGRLGRSFGCPAVPTELSKDIIQKIKGGSCLYIHAPIESYSSTSNIIRKISSNIKG
jgi:hypothetical protein